MMYNSASQKILILLIAVIFVLVCINDYSHAQSSMPDYILLENITEALSLPHNVSVDKNENLYVVEHNAKQIIVFDQNGDKIKSFSVSPHKPRAVEVDNNGRIYISFGDYYNTYGFVRVYENDFGDHLNPLFYLGAENGEFIRPNDMAIDEGTGYIYIVDYEADIVKVFNPANPATPVNSFDGSDANDGVGGVFKESASIAIDAVNQEIIVLDRPITVTGVSGARIQFFDMSGNYIIAYDKYSVEQLSCTLNKPYFLDIDSAGRIYIGESAWGTIHVSDRSGECLGEIPNDGDLSNASAVAISKSNILYATHLKTYVKRFGLLTYTMMDIDPASLSFDWNRGYDPPASKNVDISNIGTAVLDWTVGSDKSWITISTTSGSTAVSSVSTISIGVDTTGLLAGTYTGTVTVTSGTGGTEEIEINLTVNEIALQANACTDNDATPCSFEIYEGDIFTLDSSLSAGFIVSRSWDIGDDGSFEYENLTSVTQDHVFTTEGDYNVRLTVKNDLGATSSSTIQVYVLDSVPTANFTGSPTSGGGPLTVIFTNSSTGYDQSLTYEWDFDNDGTVDSYDEHPSYDYSGVGVYTVKLKAIDSDGSDNSLIKTDYITVVFDTCENSLPVKIGATGYSTIQEAYAAAAEGATIKTQAVRFVDAPDLNGGKTVTLEGGYSCDYSSVIGKTVISGTTKITSGTVTMGGFIFE